MTRTNQRRLVLYPAAFAIAAVLCALAVTARSRATRELIGTLQNGGELMARVGLADKAEENARRILAMDPENLDARLLLACAYQQTSRYDDAIREYERACRQTAAPEQRRYVELVLADVHRLKKDYAEARARLTRYRAAHGDDAGAAMVEGELHVDLGDPAAAATCFRRAADASPPAEGARMALARACLKLGDKPGALAALEAVVRSERRTHGVWYAIAELRRDAGDLAGARAALGSALASEPQATRRRLEADRAAWGELAAAPGTGGRGNEVSTPATPDTVPPAVLEQG